MGYEEISWTEASSEKSEVVGCVHERSMILSCIMIGGTGWAKLRLSYFTKYMV